MSLLYAHDHKFRYDGSSYYSTGCFSNDVLKRYASVFGRFKLIARSVPMDQTPERLSKVDDQMATILPIDQNTQRLHALVQESDYVICRLPSFIGNRVFSLARKYKKPCLVELVGCPWDSFRLHSWRGKLIAPYMYFRTRRIVKQAKWVLYVTEDFLQKRYPTKGNTISCSNVMIDSVEECLQEKRITKIRNNTQDIYRIGTTAAVDVAYKGQEYVIRALALLKQRGITGFEYQMVGGGNQERLTKLARDLGVETQVKMIGQLQRTQVMDWLDQMDIYIQSSLTEGLPRALIEAMSRGLLCFGTQVGGIPELLDNKHLFSVKNKKQIPEVLADLLMHVSQAELEQQAADNMEKSKQYVRSTLDNRRQAFYISMKASVL